MTSWILILLALSPPLPKPMPMLEPLCEFACAELGMAMTKPGPYATDEVRSLCFCGKETEC